MKKLLLTLLLLLGIGYVAQAEDTAEMKPSDFTNSTNSDYTAVRSYTSPITGISYLIGAWVENDQFQQNKTKSCFFEIVDNPNGYIIDKVSFVDLSSNSTTKPVTASFFTAQKSDSRLTITNGAPASKKDPSISGGVNVAYNELGECFEPDAAYFAYVVKSTAGGFKFSGIQITYQEATDARTELLLMYEPNELILNLGDEFHQPTLKALLDEENCEEAMELVEYTSDNPKLLDVFEDGTMVLSHDINDMVGTATITATLKENDTYRAIPATFTLHVISPGNNSVLFDVDTDEKYEHTASVESIKDDVVELSFKKNDATTPPRYWTSGSEKAVRLYANNTMTISVPKGYVLVSATATPALSADFKANVGRFNGIWEAKDAEGNDIQTNTVTFTCTSKNYVGKTIIVHYKSDTEVVGFEHRLYGHGTYATLNYTIYINNHDDDLDYYAVKLHIDEDGHYSSEQHEIRAYEPQQGAIKRVSPAEGKTYTHIATGTITTDNINNTGAPMDHTFSIKLNHNGTDLEEHTFTDQNLKDEYGKTLTTSGVNNTTGIEDVTVEGTDAPEYFNLQGVRVARPEAGNIYLVRRAGKVEKQLVK